MEKNVLTRTCSNNLYHYNLTEISMKSSNSRVVIAELHCLRTMLRRMCPDDIFFADVMEQLSIAMKDFGFMIIQTLVTDIEPGEHSFFNKAKLLPGCPVSSKFCHVEDGFWPPNIDIHSCI